MTMSEMLGIKNWNIEQTTGYKPISTFYTDLSIAELYDLKAVKESVRQIREEWHENTEMFTEFIMAVNWKSWEHQDDFTLCEYYAKLYYELCDWVFENWTEEQQKYFIKTTD